jgi:hypothetical protein
MANPNPDEQKVPDNPPPRWFPVMEMNTSDACLKGLTSRLDAYRGQTEWKIEGSTVVREFSKKLFMERTYTLPPRHDRPAWAEGRRAMTTPSEEKRLNRRGRSEGLFSVWFAYNFTVPITPWPSSLPSCSSSAGSPAGSQTPARCS